MTTFDQISNQNLSLQNQHEEMDYFSGIFQNRLSKWISIIFSILGSILAIFMIYCIIWFERYGLDVRKTLINRLFLSLDYIGIIWLSLFQQLDVLRYLYGPMPQLVCHLTDYSKFALTNQIFTTFAFIMITRYILIFYLKNPAGFYNEFWYKFILAWIIMFSWTSQIVVYLGPGKHFPNFYICAGISPLPDETGGEKNYTFNSCVRLCSVLIQMVIAIRIKLYKWKYSNVIGKTFQFGSENIFPYVFVLFVIIIQFPREKIELSKLNEYPFYLTEYFFTLIRPILTGLLVASVKFSKDSKFRSVLVKKIKDYKSLFQD